MTKAILAAIAMLAAMLGASPAAAQYAQTYNSFNTFNGTQGAGGFTYGLTDLAGNVTLFKPSSDCFIDDAICLQQTAVGGQVPFFSKNTAPAEQGTILVPDDRLLTHSAGDGLLPFITFTAPATGLYAVLSNFSVQNTDPTDVGVYLIQNNWRAPSFTLLNGDQILDKNNKSYEVRMGFNLARGDIIGFALGREGQGFNDFTGVNFVVLSNIPEPATWALMITGIGLVGWSLRRRRSVAGSVAAA